MSATAKGGTWAARLISLVKSRMMTGAGLTMASTGTYVIYTDSFRNIKIAESFQRGSILPPLSETQHQTPYFQRPREEAYIRRLLGPTFTGEYYFIHGEVGTGKTRLVVECVKNLIATSGKKKEGAPIYVLASQGKSFADTLAASVNYSFDEHISFKFFIRYLLGIHSMPNKSEDQKLGRVLHAIEEASFAYVKKHGRPAVLVIDDTHHLVVNRPGSLQRIQTKAKLWADTNIVKVVLVSNDEETELVMQENQSSWSRVDNPLYIGDLSQDDAIRFLMMSGLDKATKNNTHGIKILKKLTYINNELAEKVTALVGGRVQHLLQFQRDIFEGSTFAKAAARLKRKECEKLMTVQKYDSILQAVTTLMAEPQRKMAMDHFMKMVSLKEFSLLLNQNILSIQRQGAGLFVKFDSYLLENVTKDWLDSRLM